jgi:septal ring factor EnvC (AmiA/AmiB activator)
MHSRMDARIIELEYANEQNTQTISSLIARIEKLEARPTLYQRKSVYGEPIGIVYTHGQTKAHSP